MTEHHDDIELDTSGQDDSGQDDSGGFVALAVLAAALGAGAAILLAPDEGSKTRKRVRRRLQSLGGDAVGRMEKLQREIRRRKNQSRRERKLIALAGLLVGAGISALMSPQGADVRSRLGGTLGRIKVGAIDRIERIRARPGDPDPSQEENREVRSVQELGRDPNTVF